MAALASSSKASASQESGPSSVPFRGSSVPRSRKNAASLSLMSEMPPSRSTSNSSRSAWLVLDADDDALPFLRTLHSNTPGRSTELASGSASPAARSSEKLTESTNMVSPGGNPSSRVNSSSSDGRSQGAKHETGLTNTTQASEGAEKDRRMSLSHHAATGTGSTGKRSFISRLRGTGGSVSNASVFTAAPGSSTSAATPMSTSGSWSIVDPPTSIKEEGSTNQPPLRTVHLAFSSLASEGAAQHAAGLVARASPSLLPSPTQAPNQLAEQLHPDRLDATNIAGLVQTVQPEAIYIGSAQSRSTSEALLPYYESVLSVPCSSTKMVILEPPAVRRLTTSQAAALNELARSHSIALSLPIRWTSLWTANIEETLLGLELLHEVQEEQRQAAVTVNGSGDADVSVNTGFDVSMSNIPTGLSEGRLNELAELDAIKTQVNQLKRELQLRDQRITELNKQANEQQQQQKQQQPGVAAVRNTAAKSIATAVEPNTPDCGGSSTQEENSPAARVEGTGLSTAEDTTSPAPGIANSAFPTSTTPSSPLPATPTSVPVSAHRLATIAQPTTPTAASLAPAAPIISPTSSPNGSRSSSKVIASLTAELAETKSQLEATRLALASTKAQSASYQAAAEEMRGTLSRARLENDSSVTILARKDRQISEALERARKAEAEAKELGRASREWGTRVREVEDELGKERIKRSRAEQAYEALSSEWKSARERLITQVRELKQSHKASLTDLADEYKKVLDFKHRLTHHSPSSPTSPDPSNLVADLAALNTNMQAYLDKHIHPLSSALKQLEQRESAQIVDRIAYLTDELTRIKTLMRRGDISHPSQIPPSPL